MIAPTIHSESVPATARLMEPAQPVASVTITPAIASQSGSCNGDKLAHAREKDETVRAHPSNESKPLLNVNTAAQASANVPR